jgi:hypothetical protein
MNTLNENSPTSPAEEKPQWLAERWPELRSPEPARDLWPDIARVLSSQEREVSERRRPRAALAAGLLLVALSASLAWQNLQQQRSYAQLRIDAQQQVEQRLRQIEAPYRYARVSYQSAWPELRAALPADTAQVIEANLRVIEQARADIERALNAEPDDPHLQALLHQVLEQELGLYKTAVRLGSTAPLI